MAKHIKFYPASYEGPGWYAWYENRATGLAEVKRVALPHYTDREVMSLCRRKGLRKPHLVQTYHEFVEELEKGWQ